MNKLEGIIKNILVQDELSLIEVQVNNDLFTAILINSKEDNLLINQKVSLVFKETEVSLAKNLIGSISIRNRIKVKILSITKGKLLSKILLSYNDTKLISIITTKATNELELKINDEIEALIKTNEITIMKI
ncbi:MAG: TOBE domain-containing protein [Candidatus Sericytochromatia bacterium]